MLLTLVTARFALFVRRKSPAMARMGDQKAVARSLSNLANIVKLQGDNPGAVPVRRESLDFQTVGDRTGVAWSTNYQGDSSATRVTPKHGKYYEQAWRYFENSAMAGESQGRSLTRKLARERENIPQRTGLPGEHETVSGSGPQTRYRPPAGTLRLLGRSSMIANVRCGWRARPLRCAKDWRSPHAEEGQAGSSSKSGSSSIDVHGCTTAWSEGWKTPIEEAVEEVLMPELVLPRA